jgi:LmbE family N-acetylglucosaminyl deacetylase
MMAPNPSDASSRIAAGTVDTRARAAESAPAELSCWTPGEHRPSSTLGARVPHWRAVPPSPVRARLVIVAPRPGDETLACAGLMLWCAHHDVATTIVAVTDGETSGAHGARADDAGIRSRVSERDVALATLGVRVAVRRFAMHEGELTSRRDEVAEGLEPLLDDRSICVAPWRADGPDDYEATAWAAARAAARAGAPLWEAPVWGRLDGRFDLSDAGRAARALDLGPLLRERKQAAVAAFRHPLVPAGPAVHPSVMAARAVQALTTSVEWFWHPSDGGLHPPSAP